VSDSQHDHLSRISTLWTQLFRAHGGCAEEARAAQEAIIERYSSTVYRYLRKVLGDADAADEVFQQFALGLVRGDFRHADPSKGRFRDYLKLSLLRLVSKYRRRAAGEPLGAEQAAASQAFQTEDQLTSAFLASCRDDLLDRAWAKLRDLESQTGQPFFSVLDYRAHHPQATSEQMAEDLSGQPGCRGATPAGVRKTLERARMKFADLLLDEVAEGLGSPTRDALEQEIIDLGLHSYCRSALGRRFG